MGWIVGRTVVAATFVLASTLAEETLNSGIHGGYTASREAPSGWQTRDTLVICSCCCLRLMCGFWKPYLITELSLFDYLT